MSQPATSYTAPLDDAELDAAIRRLPKAERHIHLEGAYRWDTVRAFHPDGASLPQSPPWLARERPFPTFEAFLATFRQYIRPATGTTEAIVRHCAEVLADLAAQNVVYAELIFSPVAHRTRGLAQPEVLDALRRGKEAAKVDGSMKVEMIYGALCDRPPTLVFAELEEALQLAGPAADGLIQGIDLQGALCPDFARGFAPVFDLARDAGLRLRAHAGETLGPQSVRDAITELGVDHLSHGIRAAEDPALVAELARRGTWLHTCPTSNVLLGIAPSYAAHPLRALQQAGCRVTVNSDDPLLFGATITDEYRTLVREMGFTLDELTELAKRGRASR